MSLQKAYNKRIQSLHNYLLSNGDLREYFTTHRALLKALTVTMNESETIICIEASVREESQEYLSWDGCDDYKFKSYVGRNLEEMQIDDSMMRSTLRALWFYAEALQEGEEKKPHGIQFQKATTRKRRVRNRRININQTI